MTTEKPSDPLTDFSGCHVGITRNFSRLGELPGFLQQAPSSAELSQLAAELRRFFHDVVLQHHADEEKELFSAVKGVLGEHLDKAMLASGYIGRLTEEHRHLEKLWQIIEPELKQLEKGKPVTLNAAAMRQLSEDYLAHASFEEQYFLPLAEELLSENELSALGMSLHMRHQEHNAIKRYI